MSAEYSAEKVREQAAKELRCGLYAKTWDMLTAYAKRIEADERAVTEDIARKAYAALETEGDAIECMRKALLAVWPNPPAQAAQVDTWQIVCDAIRKHQFSDDSRRGRMTIDVELLLHEINVCRYAPTAEPVAQGEEWAELRIGAPAWPGQREGKAPPEGWVHVSVNNLADLAIHSPDAADSVRVTDAMVYRFHQANRAKCVEIGSQEPMSTEAIRAGLIAAIAAQGQGEPDPMDAIVQHCMVTEAVSPDSADPYGTISRIIDWHQANTAPPASPAGVPDGWQLVPVELTPEMSDAWAGTHCPDLQGLSDDEANAKVAAINWAAFLAASPSAPSDDELPGMWSASDFTGGDPDERCHAERQQPTQRAEGE